MATIKNLLIRIGIDDAKVSSGVAKVNRSLDSIASRVEHLEKVGKVGQFAALAGSVIQLGRAFAPAALSIGQFVAAAAPAAGAVLALPAAFAAVGAAVATVKVGISGIGDAMKAAAGGDAKKLQAALKNLAPSARQFVTVMAQARNSFDPVRRAVQQKLFEGLAAQIRVVALRALPGLRVGMTDVATQMNGLARAGLNAAKTPLFSGVLRATLGTTAAVLESFKPAVQPLILGLLRLVKIGLPLVEIFGQWAGRMATLGAQWLNSERTATRFARAIDRAIGVFRAGSDAQTKFHNVGLQLRVVWDQLSRIGKNVWNIIQAIGQAMGNSTGPATNLLDLIGSLTERLAAWAQSAQGQQQLSQLFNDLQQVASNLFEILPGVGGVLSIILQLINSLPAPVRNTALQFLAWSIVLGRLTGPIGGAIKLLGGLGKAAGAINRFGAGAGKAIGAIGKGVGVVGAGTGRAAGAIGTALGRAARAAGSAAVTVGRAVGTMLLSLGRLAIQAAIAAGRVVAQWVLMGVQSLIQAGRMALAWIIAMGPIGLIIAAVVGIAALIILNWGKIWSATKTAWNATVGAISAAVSWVIGFVSKHWRLLITIVLGPFGLIIALVTKYWSQITGAVSAAVRGVITAVGWLAALPGRVAGWFLSMARGAISYAGGLLRYISGIPGAIGRAFAGAGSWLVNAGKNILYGLWNGLVSVSSWLARNLWNLVKSIIPGVVQRVLGIASPSKVLARLGAFAGQGLAEGILGTASLVSRAAGRLGQAAVPQMPGAGPMAGPVAPGAVAAAASAPRRVAAASAGGGTVVLEVRSGGSRMDDFLVELIRKSVRVKGGGNVQLALGDS